MAMSAVQQSSVVSAKIETQSSERQAGTTPAVETRPRLGLRPTMLLSPAGTRPEPAVSVLEQLERQGREPGDLPRELDALVMALLSENALARPGTTGEVIDRL